MWNLLVFGVLLIGAQQGEAFSNEGTRFAVALPPASEDILSEITMIARQDTTVIVELPFMVTFVVDLIADEPSHFDLGGRVPRCHDGVEDTSIILFSNGPFSAFLTNAEHTHPRNPDATILRPITNDTGSIFIVTYSDAAAPDHPDFRPKSFYMVAAQEDGTEVQVKREFNDTFIIVEEVTLSSHKTLTVDSYQDDPNSMIDYTGYWVEASKPVAVYSGHGCAAFPLSAPHEWSRSLFESMPYAGEMGESYITSPLHFGANEIGSVLRVISTVDGTIISIPAIGYEEEHVAGSFYEFDYRIGRQATPIYCSDPCVAVQYAAQAEAGTSPGGRHMNPFMLVLTPMDSFTSDAQFSTPSFSNDTVMALSIIVDFYPVDDLYLDGVNLEDLDWLIVGGGVGVVATLSIEVGGHSLYTTDPAHGFAAYYQSSYGDVMEDGRSYGYPVGYTGGGNGVPN